jgi:SOS regulatory protein LexA
MRTKDTDKMNRIVSFIEERYMKDNTVPTINEIADYMDMEKGNVSRYLADMSERGLIDMSNGLRNARTRNMNKIKSLIDNIPIVGEIACGTPILAQENVESYIYLSRALLGEGKFFALRAKGCSMINANINEGDIVIIKQQNTANDGQIIVALIDDEATLKRYYRDTRKRMIRLHPENDEMEDMYFDKVDIQGVVKKVIKDVE